MVVPRRTVPMHADTIEMRHQTAKSESLDLEVVVLTPPLHTVDPSIVVEAAPSRTTNQESVLHWRKVDDDRHGEEEVNCHLSYGMPRAAARENGDGKEFRSERVCVDFNVVLPAGFVLISAEPIEVRHLTVQELVQNLPWNELVPKCVHRLHVKHRGQ